MTLHWDSHSCSQWQKLMVFQSQAAQRQRPDGRSLIKYPNIHTGARLPVMTRAISYARQQSSALLSEVLCINVTTVLIRFMWAQLEAWLHKNGGRHPHTYHFVSFQLIPNPICELLEICLPIFSACTQNYYIAVPRFQPECVQHGACQCLQLHPERVPRRDKTHPFGLCLSLLFIQPWNGVCKTREDFAD